MAEPSRNHPVEEDIQPPKIIFLGNDNVGKTTFIKRYCEYMIDYCRCDHYDGPFLGFSQFVLYINRHGKRVPFRLLDLPTGTTLESRSLQYPSTASAIVLCYSVDSSESFANAWERWVPEFRAHYPNTRSYLLGLKCDMRLEMRAANKMPVYADRARRIHQMHGFDGEYMECSVEGNPEFARRCMDRIIDDVFRYDPNV